MKPEYNFTGKKGVGAKYGNELYEVMQILKHLSQLMTR